MGSVGGNLSLPLPTGGLSNLGLLRGVKTGSPAGRTPQGWRTPVTLRVLREIGSPALLGGVWPGEDSVSLKVRRDSLAGAERTGIWVGALGNHSGKAVPNSGARPCPRFGARLRVESLSTVLRFEEALGLRVKLIAENGIVIGPFQEGNKEADQGLLAPSLGPKGNNRLILAGNEGLGRRQERELVYWQERRAPRDALSPCISTKVLGTRDLKFFVSCVSPTSPLFG